MEEGWGIPVRSSDLEGQSNRGGAGNGDQGDKCWGSSIQCNKEAQGTVTNRFVENSYDLHFFKTVHVFLPQAFLYRVLFVVYIDTGITPTTLHVGLLAHTDSCFSHGCASRTSQPEGTGSFSDVLGRFIFQSKSCGWVYMRASAPCSGA